MSNKALYTGRRGMPKMDWKNPSYKAHPFLSMSIDNFGNARLWDSVPDGWVLCGQVGYAIGHEVTVYDVYTHPSRDGHYEWNSRAVCGYFMKPAIMWLYDPIPF